MIVHADDGGKIVKVSFSFTPHISLFSTYFVQVAFDTFHKSSLSVDTDKERSKKKNPSASHRTRCSVRYRVITKFTLNFNTFLFHLHKRTYAPNGVPSLVQVCPPTVEFKSTSQMWRVRSVGRIHTFPFCRVPINGGHLIRFHQFTYAIAIE